MRRIQYIIFGIIFYSSIATAATNSDYAAWSGAASAGLAVSDVVVNAKTKNSVTQLQSLESYSARVSELTATEKTFSTNLAIAQDRLHKVQRDLQGILQNQVNAEKEIKKLQFEVAALEAQINPVNLRHEIGVRQRMAISLQTRIRDLELSHLSPEAAEIQLKTAKIDLSRIYREISDLESRISDPAIRHQIQQRNRMILGNQMLLVELKKQEDIAVRGMRSVVGTVDRLDQVVKQFTQQRNVRMKSAAAKVTEMKERISLLKGVRLTNKVLLGTALATFAVNAHFAYGATNDLQAAEYERREDQQINEADRSKINDAIRNINAF